MKLVPPIRRVDTARSHFYKDAAGTRVPGVTTIIDGGNPKPALINWAANATADATVDAWDVLSGMSPAKRLDWMRKARYIEKDAASKRGTEIHGFGEALVHGEEVNVPEELVGYVESYARFLDAFDVQPVHVEFGVGNYRHAYAGTADLIAEVTIPKIGRQRMLIDLKSNKSGIFAETALQLAAYRYAEVIIPNGDGDETPMIEVDATAAVHITPNDAHLIPVTTNEDVFRTFLYCQQVAAFGKVGGDLIGAAVAPATDSLFRLVRDETS